MKKLVIIDGQGGRIGQMLTESIVREKLPFEIVVIGTNSIATSAMLKAGAKAGATGENAVIVASRNADVITGPIAILSADSLLGEITPAMAVAIGQSRAVKLLLPVSHCNNQVVGVKQLTLNEMVTEAVDKLRELAK